jgi:hypothetical protein
VNGKGGRAAGRHVVEIMMRAKSKPERYKRDGGVYLCRLPGMAIADVFDLV